MEDKTMASVYCDRCKKYFVGSHVCIPIDNLANKDNSGILDRMQKICDEFQKTIKEMKEIAEE